MVPLKIIDELVSELERLLVEERCSCERSGGRLLGKAEIRVLGQMSLMMDDDARENLPLIRTADVDALVSGESVIRTMFKKCLEKRGLELDDLSAEAWIPPGASFRSYYQSPLLAVSYLDPIAVLTSKAVKAKEKNHALVRAALKYYGQNLAESIVRNGGDLDFFRKRKVLEL